MSNIEYEVQVYSGSEYHQAYFLHTMPDGVTERIFIGTIEHEEDGWTSGHAPWPQYPMKTREEVGALLRNSMVVQRTECKTCGSLNVTGIEYPYDHPKHYDGVSEWRCNRCTTRWDRFTGKILHEGKLGES